MKVETTQRGFEIIRFEDHNERECSLQQSSAIGDCSSPGASFVWLGLDNQAERMHLDRQQVRQLIKRLQNWVDTGSFKFKGNAEVTN